MTRAELIDRRPHRGTWLQTERAAHEAWARLIDKSPLAAKIMHVLTARVGNHNAAVISQKNLARLAHASERGVRDALRVLEADRWLEMRQIGGRGTVNAYVLNDRVVWSGKRDGILEPFEPQCRRRIGGGARRGRRHGIGGARRDRECGRTLRAWHTTAAARRRNRRARRLRLVLQRAQRLVRRRQVGGVGEAEGADEVVRFGVELATCVSGGMRKGGGREGVAYGGVVFVCI